METIEQEAECAPEPVASFREDLAGWCGNHVSVLRLGPSRDFRASVNCFKTVAEIRDVVPLAEMYFLLCAIAPSICILFRCILG